MGRGRAPCCEKIGLNRGSWTPAEDMRLVAYIQNFGHGNWRALPKQAGLLRCGKSCRLRWINYLRPDIKRGNFSKDEEDTIIKLHSLLGNKWSKIASCLPGRTDNEIKNVWNTHLKKRVVSTKQQKLPSPSSSADEQSDVEIKTGDNNAKIPESTQTLVSSENSQYSGESQDASEGKIEIVIEPSLDMSFMLDDSELFNLSSSSSNDSDSTNTNNQDQDQDPLWNIMDEEYPNFMLGDCCEEQTNNRTTTLGEESSCSEDESKRLLANLEKELDLDFWGDEDNLQQSLSDPVSCYFQRAL